MATQAKPKISVIIPSYNRAEILTLCLDALEKQDFPKSEYEVIVVNDGSQDQTEKILQQFALKKGMVLKTITQKNCGQGNARNNGLRHAAGEVILFLGDDIIAAPDLLKQHWTTHKEHHEPEAAVLGFIDWHPNIQVNDYMKWMVNDSAIFGRFGGHQFAFDKLKRGVKPDFNYFYTSNISLKRGFLGEMPFDPDFSNYGWEDIELGYRLEKKGMKLHFNGKAIGYHHHALDESGLEQRMEMIGRSAHIIGRKHPELHKIPSFPKKIAFILLSNAISLAIIKTLNPLTGRRLQPLYYYALSKKYFLQGVKKGII